MAPPAAASGEPVLCNLAIKRESLGDSAPRATVQEENGSARSGIHPAQRLRGHDRLRPVRRNPSISERPGAEGSGSRVHCRVSGQPLYRCLRPLLAGSFEVVVNIYSLHRKIPCAMVRSRVSFGRFMHAEHDLSSSCEKAKPPARGGRKTAGLT